MARCFESKPSFKPSSVGDPNSFHSVSLSPDEPVISVESPVSDEIEQTDFKDITSSDDFRRLQQQDPSLQPLFDKVEESPYPISRSFYFLKDGILMHHEAKIKKIIQCKPACGAKIFAK